MTGPKRPSSSRLPCFHAAVRTGGTPEESVSVPKLVYDFTEGNRDLKDLLGGKGANLAEMTNLGLPVPGGFIITTDACRYCLKEGKVPEGLAAEVTTHLRQLEKIFG